MKALKIIGTVLLSTLVLLLVISFFLPSTVSVQRSRVIDASPDAVHAQLSDFRNWVSWMPWLKKDPEMRIEWGEQTAGVGASYKWFSNHPEVGNGRITLVASEPGASVETEMYFMESKDPAFGSFQLEPTAEGTRVTWQMRTDMGKNPIGKFMGLMMDSWVGADFEMGLADLDRVAQANPVPEPDRKLVTTE